MSIIDSKGIKDRLASLETPKLDKKMALDKEADPLQAAQPTGSTFDPWKGARPAKGPPGVGETPEVKPHIAAGAALTQEGH